MEENKKNDESSTYSLFVYGIRSQLTRDYYLRRLRIFFNHINLLPSESMEVRCNTFSLNGVKDPHWAFNSIINFLQFQKGRVQRNEITGATLGNFVKSIKLFCEMYDITIPWKKNYSRVTKDAPPCGRKGAYDRGNSKNL